MKTSALHYVGAQSCVFDAILGALIVCEAILKIMKMLPFKLVPVDKAQGKNRLRSLYFLTSHCSAIFTILKNVATLPHYHHPYCFDRQSLLCRLIVHFRNKCHSMQSNVEHGNTVETRFYQFANSIHSLFRCTVISLLRHIKMYE